MGRAQGGVRGAAPCATRENEEETTGEGGTVSRSVGRPLRYLPRTDQRTRTLAAAVSLDL